jgi:CRP-like cAMP-binding protein
VIIHVARVRDIDLSGVQLLTQVVERFRQRGVPVAISGLAVLQSSRPGLHKLLVELGVLETVGQENLHVTLDRALEAFEDLLLADHGIAPATGALDLAEFEELTDLSVAQRDELAKLVEEKELAEGQVLFEQGARAEAISFVRRGRLAIINKNGTGEARVAVFGRGEVVGPRAVFDDAVWQSSVRAEEQSAVYILPHSAIVTLRAEQPLVLEALERCLLRITVKRMDALRTELAVFGES